jgi:site-specific DNA-methyltransferase (adenine-specific)
MRLEIIHDDNLKYLKTREDRTFDLIYIDPPFNTGKAQSRKQTQMTHSEDDYDRVGFQGKKYKTKVLSEISYQDSFGDNFMDFITPRLVEAHRLLKEDGSLFVHLDFREVHYVKVYLDELFGGRDHFMNEIIWAYDYGARTKKLWPRKHDSILWYAKDPKNYTFNIDECDRIPYMAPGLVGKEKAALGKTPTDVWWHTIVPTNGREKVGYPTQKPRGVIDRIVKVHSRPGDFLLDFFAGSGTFGESALENGRNCVLVDQNPQAIEVMSLRLKNFL